MFFCSLPLDSSSLLLLLEPDVLELQWAGDEANLAALFHQPADPPVVVELLRGDNKNIRKKRDAFITLSADSREKNTVTYCSSRCCQVKILY